MRPPVTMPRLSQGTRAGQQRQDLAPSVPPPSRPSAVLPPQARGEAEILTPSEVLALLNQISTTSSIGLRNRALITVLYRAGLRHAEALALFPKDIDLAAGSIACSMEKETAAEPSGSIREVVA
jgi:integrase